MPEMTREQKDWLRANAPLAASPGELAVIAVIVAFLFFWLVT